MGRFIFCGVFAFDGDEHKVSVPLWILKQLEIQSGDIVSVELVMAPIPKGLFAKFEPMTKSFLQITNPKAVLEYGLRNYVCITREDVISIYYNQNIYELKVCETLPSDTIVINECDLTVDFQEMKEIIELPEECDLDQIQSQNGKKGFEAFSGTGHTAQGQKVMPVLSTSNSNEIIREKVGIPDYGYKIGTIFFKRYKSDLTSVDTKPDNPKDSGGPGNGQKKDEISEKKEPRRKGPVTRSQTQRIKQKAKQTKTDSITPTEKSQSDPKRRKRNDKQV